MSNYKLCPFVPPPAFLIGVYTAQQVLGSYATQSGFCQRDGSDLFLYQNKQGFMYLLEGSGRMVHTPRSGAGDSAYRIRRDWC